MHAPHLSRKARILLTGLFITAAGLWALTIACAWWIRSEDGEGLARAAAVTVTVSLVVWMAALNVRDRHAALVLRVLADVTRPADQGKTTVPLQVVREIPRPSPAQEPR